MYTEMKPIHFLLVEDDDRHAKLVKWGLERNKIISTLDRVKDGEEAIQYLKKRAPFESVRRPDVVLLDLKIPKIDGHEVLALTKSDEELKNIPIIILTTSERLSDRQKAYGNHVNSYLVKPIDLVKFQKNIADLGFDCSI